MIELIHDDCMNYMATLEDNAFELAIVDPPYGINVANMTMGLGKSKKSSKAHNRKYKYSDWDNNVPTQDYFNELKRVSKSQMIFGGNYFDIGACKHFVIWYKGIPEGLSFSDCEFIWTSFSKAQRIYRLSVYSEKEAGKFHPTKKPVKLYEWLLKSYAKEGDKILDTHLGSGSIAIACHYLGFDLTACELDKDYYEAAMKRIEQETKQISMF